MSISEYIELRNSSLIMNITKKDEPFSNNIEEDFFNELPKEIQDSLLKSIEQSKNGELISHEEVMAKYKK